MLLRQPARMQAVQSPIIPVVAELIKQHPGTISLGQGVVHYGPPREVIEYIAKCLSDPNNHKYQAVQGIPPLLEAIEAKLAAENGIRLDDGSHVVVTAGGNMAFMNAILAIADPGDEIILQTPYYFNHEMAVTIAGCCAVLVATDENYQLRPEAIRAAITNRTRAIVTISPNNPTGAVYPEAALREVNDICREQGLYHINDEAYEYFTYDDARHFSPGSIAGSETYTLSLYSLSKAYGFASWRIGYMVVPEHLLVAVKKIQDTILICPPVISQYAALGALQVGSTYCHNKLNDIVEVRQIVLDELQTIADICTVPPAAGAFYFLLRVQTEMGAMEVVERLIREHGIAAIPGTTFGMNDGCYLRVAYGTLQKTKAKGSIGRLVQGLKAIVV
ncbi:MAG: pyridoxal phosphate-dependent aminotransferase [Abitibacteriaceae bacterium]|nr:pyridoxal phosphate-dependent aminotransferase [Abditibacteriaceae bacterium]